MTTSLPLSKALFEKGLKIETEKWVGERIEYNPETQITTTIPFLVNNEDKENDDYGQLYPAYSTDELLVILFTTPISRIGMTPNSVWDDSAIKIIPMNFYGEIPEALGLMCLWLLDNGYHFNGKELVR